MSDDSGSRHYRDGCPFGIFLALLLMPYALVRYAIDERRRKAK